MASNDYFCSLTQAYNFQKDSQEPVGHLTSITIGTSVLAADTTLTLPTTFATAAVVGVISDLSWNGGYADPIHIRCNISNANQVTVSVLTNTDLSNTLVQMNFNIYNFDPVNKVYYLSCTSNLTALNGFVNKSGGNLSLSVQTENDHTVESPLNYRMYIGTMPQPTAQTINFAANNTAKYVKSWGVSVS